MIRLIKHESCEVVRNDEHDVNHKNIKHNMMKVLTIMYMQTYETKQMNNDKHDANHENNKTH